MDSEFVVTCTLCKEIQNIPAPCNVANLMEIVLRWLIGNDGGSILRRSSVGKRLPSKVISRQTESKYTALIRR